MTEQTLKFRKLTEDYVKYKTEFGVEKFNLLNKNLTVANEKIRELESKNRELSKCKGDNNNNKANCTLFFFCSECRADQKDIRRLL